MDAEGNCDVSPRGGPAGFVAVLDARTVAIPDATGNKRLVFEPGDRTNFSSDSDVLVLTLQERAVSELARVLRPKRGTYTLQSASELRFIVKPSIVRDRDGNVVEILGE